MSLWNILSPACNGMIRIAGSGNELFGTVIRHGLINKTIAVRVSARNWNNKYQMWLYSHKNKLVHDETNYCVTGDKVIIKSCKKLSKQKAYYVKNIVKPFSRDEFNRAKSPSTETAHIH
jgi:ribosomal protein S17